MSSVLRLRPAKVGIGLFADRPLITNPGVSFGDRYYATNTGASYVVTSTAAGAKQWSTDPTTSVGSITTYLGGAIVQRRGTAASLVCDTGGISDYIVGVTSTAAPRTITLPAAADGRVIVVKDESGGAAAQNITVQGAGGSTIDGAASSVINTNFGSRGFYSDGTNWFAT